MHISTFLTVGYTYVSETDMLVQKHIEIWAFGCFYRPRERKNGTRRLDLEASS
jgi:hypothetical protein